MEYLWMRLNKVNNESCFDLEGASFGEFAFSTCGLAKDILAIVACNDGLGMAEDNGGFVASSAFYIHEVRVGGWDQTLELVALSFFFQGRVEEVSIHFVVY